MFLYDSSTGRRLGADWPDQTFAEHVFAVFYRFGSGASRQIGGRFFSFHGVVGQYPVYFELSVWQCLGLTIMCVSCVCAFLFVYFEKKFVCLFCSVFLEQSCWVASTLRYACPSPVFGRYGGMLRRLPPIKGFPRKPFFFFFTKKRLQQAKAAPRARDSGQLHTLFVFLCLAGNRTDILPTYGAFFCEVFGGRG